MRAVSNTSPLNYLILIGFAEVLRELFTEVLIPAAVLEELQSPGAPAEVRVWITRSPEWLRVDRSGVIAAELQVLDSGESAVLPWRSAERSRPFSLTKGRRDASRVTEA